MGKGFFKPRSPSSLQATHIKKDGSHNSPSISSFPSSRRPCTSRSRVPCPLRPVLISSNSCLSPSINLDLQPSALSIDYPTASKPTTPVSATIPAQTPPMSQTRLQIQSIAIAAMSVPLVGMLQHFDEVSSVYCSGTSGTAFAPTSQSKETRS
ncbi:Putative protein of unknown function [Podospora comata]|uniref:Uncharacterized protein n=1 Tax=Podospora comata TaxID=48703 RepID=A0ABY6RU66_PODCO|nr:Putative protein of unknown function [Podospora comata]